MILYTGLEEGMSKCSSWVHDRARALNGDIPTVEKLKGYIQNYKKLTRGKKGLIICSKKKESSRIDSENV